MGNPPAKNHFFHFRRAVDNSLSTPVFREAISAHLCLSSPALREGGWVGRQVGTRGVVIDMFGDSVLCCKEIPGDSWRHRHDEIKIAIHKEACLSKVPVDCEVYGEFSDLLSAALREEGGELQWGRGKVRHIVESTRIEPFSPRIM